MLKSMRESFHQLKWILLAVVAAFIIGFVYVDMGLGGAGQRSKADDRSFAARVNGSTITYNEFQRSLTNAEERYKQMYGGQFSKELEDAMGLDRQVLESLVDQRLVLQEARRLHMEATPEEVRRKILEIPALNQGGHWGGDDLYRRYAQIYGYNSPADFEDDLARQLTIDKMESALANSIVVSPKAAEDEYKRSTENARIRYVLYSGRDSVSSIKVTPAELQAYYNANQSKYTHGEQRELKYLVSDTVRLRMGINPTEKQIRERYDSTKEQYKRPEQARILHILIKVDPKATPAEDAAMRAKAEGIVKQLRAGGDFAALAKANSQDPSSSGNGGDMGYIDRGATVQPFDEAAFSIPLNQISDPIRSQEYGYHIIKVLDRRAAGYRPFEEVRLQVGSQLANEMALQQATDEMAKVATRMKSKAPSTPVEFASYANDKVSSNDTQWFQKGSSIPGLGFNQPLVTWAFSAKQGEMSPIIRTQRGPTLAYLAGVRPAGVTAFEEVKAQVESDAKAARARELAKQKLAAAVAGATKIDDVGAKLGLTAQETSVNRQAAIPTIPGDTGALVDRALAAPVGVVQPPLIAGDGAVAFQVLEQKRATPADVQQNRASYIEQLRSQEARSLRASLLLRLRKSAKIIVNDKVLSQQKGSQEGA
jgi:peptidyl-prolyl cis-trans isomerase D